MKATKTQTLIIMIFTAFLSMKGYSQNGITLVSASPTVVCPGDSITVKYKMSNSGSTAINLFYQGGGGQIWQYPLDTMYRKPYEIVTGDTIRRIQFKIPATMNKSWCTVSGSDNTTFNIDMRCGVDVGIYEYSPVSMLPVYYDISGNRIQPVKGKLIIEQRGLTRRKVILQD